MAVAQRIPLSLRDGHLGCFQYFDNTNIFTVNNLVHMLFWICKDMSLGWIPRNGIIGSKGRCIYVALLDNTKFSLIEFVLSCILKNKM